MLAVYVDLLSWLGRFPGERDSLRFLGIDFKLPLVCVHFVVGGTMVLGLVCLSAK